jgi:hypothetical protein
MEIKIPKITAPLDLGDYNQAMAGTLVHVWINPPSEVRIRFSPISERGLALVAEQGQLHPDKNAKDKVKAEALEKELGELLEAQDVWLSEIWSQGPEGTHFSAGEVKKLRTETANTDPRLFGWMVGSSIRLIGEHAGALKKPIAA